jgi:PAS domain S-box-containing protein
MNQETSRKKLARKLAGFLVLIFLYVVLWGTIAFLLHQKAIDLHLQQQQLSEAQLKPIQKASEVNSQLIQRILNEWISQDSLSHSVLEMITDRTEYKHAFALLSSLLPDSYSQFFASPPHKFTDLIRLHLQLQDQIQSELADISRRQQRIETEQKQYEQWQETVLLIGIISTGFWILLIGLFLERTFVAPITEANHVFQELEKGHQPEPLPVSPRPNELDLLFSKINQEMKYLNDLKQIAQKIDELPPDQIQLPAPNHPLFASLQLILQKMANLQQEIKDLRWQLVGYDLLRDIFQNSKNTDELYTNTISSLVRYFHVYSGALFILKEQNPDPVLQLAATYAIQKGMKTQSTFRIGEGFVGQAAMELEPLIISTPPEEAKDRFPYLLFLPMVYQGTLFGVIELGSYSPLTSSQIDHLRKMAVLLGLVIGYSLENERSHSVLKQLQEVNAQLKIQKELLAEKQQSLLQAQQELTELNERLKDQMKRLKDTSRILSISEKKLLKILEDAYEIIAIFDHFGKLQFISPSVRHLLGYEPVEILNFFRYVHPEDAEKVKLFVEHILKYPDKEFTVEFRYKRKDKNWIYLEALGKNALREPSVQGWILYVKDISDRIAAERAARTKIKFQSLTENSPDLIMRVDDQGHFLYVNPTIERYSGYSPSFFIKKSIYNVGFSPREVRFWENLIRTTFEKKTKQDAETVFPSIMGDRVMRVEAIPEPGPNNTIDTVLLVAHDITDLKRAEQQIQAQNEKLRQINEEVLRQKKEIEEKNKDITESIKYAKRIQDSILPSEQHFKKSFSDYFILFLPRDVVSGDFYWYSEHEDAIYVAAVDCTGHGVPGGFMSIIGYYLLNQIVNEQRIQMPGEILTMLNERLQMALGQGDMTSKDGMDIALVRIDPRARKMYFAGAYRPLWLWTRSALQEIPGDRLGIGISLFEHHNQSFSTQELYYEPGDILYLFTDGIIDQFGGPNGKKLTPKRFREMLFQFYRHPLSKQKELLLQALGKWQGNYPQTDDILVLGLKLP